MKLVLPLVLALVGIGAGVGAGLTLRPASETASGDMMSDAPEMEATSVFARLNNQFVVPVVVDGTVRSLVVLSLSLEVDEGAENTVYNREPRIRDAFLRVLFEHANLGGFEGPFTQTDLLEALRRNLLAAARDAVGSEVRDVLIIEIVRQDVQM
ncbi:flagellar basal body-associated FliL family protein [Aestuariibius insulae]|uniref:flagellar basal body-associated FliL family protein n=1 Tax=Aestuariibius insulae TaxID=2058287 RepID=UPI00345EAC6E